MPRFYYLILILLELSCFLPVKAQFSEYFIDTFGQNGVADVSEPFFYADCMAILPDSSIMLLGTTLYYDNEILVLKYKSNGLPDLTFGELGKRYIDLYSYNYITYLYTCAVAQDGSVFVLIGRVGYGFYVGKFTPFGTLDDTFGDGGLAYIPGINMDYSGGLGIWLRDDGGIEVLCRGNLFGVAGVKVFDVRLTPQGQMDNSFFEDGMRSLDGCLSAGMSAVQISKNDEMYYTGNMASQDNGFVLVKLDAERNVDTSFTPFAGCNGAEFEYPVKAKCLFLDETGNILVGGIAESNLFCLMKFDRNGQLDAAFGENGYALAEASGMSPGVQSINRTTNGSYVLLGTFNHNYHLANDIGLTIFDENGTLHHSFSQTEIKGYNRIELDNGQASDDYLTSAYVFADGTIVALASMYVPGQYNSYLMALNLNKIDYPVCALKGELIVSPNPIGDNFNLTFETNRLVDPLLSVYDAAGRLVYKQSLGAVGGLQTVAVVLDKKLPHGVYFLHINAAGCGAYTTIAHL